MQLTPQNRRVPHVTARHVVRVGEQLVAKPDAIGASMVKRIVAEVPMYQRVGTKLLDDVKLLARRNSQVLAEALADRGRIDRQALDYVAEHARNRVRGGVSLEAMLHAYRVGGNVFWEQCMAEAIALGLSRNTSLELARGFFEMFDELTTHAAETYVREESRLLARRNDAARDLLELLILGEIDSSWVDRHPAAPWIDPRAELLVAVGTVAESGKQLSDPVQVAHAALTTAIGTAGGPPLTAIRHGVIVALIGAHTEAPISPRLSAECARLKAAENVDLRWGVSGRCDGFGGVRGGYEQAAFALSRTTEQCPVVCPADMPALHYALNSAPAATRALIASRAPGLASLDERAMKVLRETVDAFAESNLNVTRAAAALYVHPNTLRYRLKRIQQFSGQDPHTFAGLAELQCILEALSPHGN
jgi:hypothetical protein